MLDKKRVLTLSIIFSLALIIGFVIAVPSGVTSIWTTEDDCGLVSQNVNQYSVGDYVYVNGVGVGLTGSETWTITGSSGSCDSKVVVASGVISGLYTGGFCFNAYQVAGDDCGVYKFNVEGKNDNYRVVLGGDGDVCVDNDGDGYYVGGDSCGVVDCDDNNININPGATEICNQIDDDCDGLIDEDNVCYVPECGNSIIDDGENCDWGLDNSDFCVPDYGSSCNYCSNNCVLGFVEGPFCGDGFLDISEECDDGNNLNEDGCNSVCEIEEIIPTCDYVIPLNAGWNLISVPLIPENDDTRVSNIFGSVAEDVIIIWAYTYDPSQKRNIWTHHTVTSGTFDSLASLQNVIPGYGYYVKMAEPNELCLKGELYYQVGGEDNNPVLGMPPSVTLAMDSWNLIGVYGLSNPEIDNALVSLENQNNDKYYNIIYNKEGNSPDWMQATKGYWLSVKKAFAGTDTIQYKANYEEQN